MTRHARPNRCPRCNAATFSVCVGFTKPEFRCDNGCNVWSSGTDGEPYLKHARNYCVGGAKSWVAFVWNGKELVATGLPLPDASSDRSYDAAPACHERTDTGKEVMPDDTHVSLSPLHDAAPASPSAGGGAGWQPIAAIPARQDVLVGVYVGPRWSCWVASWEGLASDLGCDGEYGDKPTHWMPLPAPPATKGPTDADL
jgi:hypothetical protein